jgi:sigma-B regulation protein RsbU (phosphoserine phosphatase)
MFVTVFVGVLNLADGELRYCNAGHDAPLLISKTVDLLQCDSNLALGVMPDWIFTAQQIILEPQTMLFLYTDGLNEAEAVDHSQFGVQRIKDVALQTTMRGENETVQLIRRMTDAVHAFVGEAEQSDDLTMLAIKYMKNNGK